MQEGRKKHAFALEASAWLMFANILLPKAGHLEKPKVGVERDYKVLRQREAINQAHKYSQPVTHTPGLLLLNAFACVSSLVSFICLRGKLGPALPPVLFIYRLSVRPSRSTTLHT